MRGLTGMRSHVDKYGIYDADVVLVPLEDGDRTINLKRNGKTVITFDLNPLSRTSQTADVTIIDNIIRGITEMIKISVSFSNMKKSVLKKLINNFDNKKNIAKSIIQINENLIKMAFNDDV